MKKIYFFWLILLISPLSLANTVVTLHIDGAIGPATAEYVKKGMEFAVKEQAHLVILEMDTPGGLDSAMRDIIQEILDADIPVITYVSPSGSRAASAGTYILYASHIASMAPATTLGAATPVSLGGGGSSDDDEDAEEQDQSSDAAMRRKVVNDAAAYIRGLAELRGRNKEWAEQAVREAVSLSAEEALKEKVIEVIADSKLSLLEKIHGKEIQIKEGKQITIDTSEVDIVSYEADWRLQLLAAVTDPSIAYILLMLGLYGLIFEFLSPGFGVPGVLGAIFLLTAALGLQMLPINYAGLAFILLGIILMVAEALVPSFGILGSGGIVSFIFGSILLFNTQDMQAFDVPIGLILGFAVVSAFLILVVAGIMIRQIRRKPDGYTGKEEMLQSVGEALEDFHGQGRIRIHSESWFAHSQVPVKLGQKVRVLSINGLVLNVEPLETEDAQADFQLNKA